jgi:hypothetical protein
MLGCWGCKWEKEQGGEVACGYLTGKAVSGGLQGRSWHPGRALASVGGGVAVLGPGVHGARVLDGCGWTEVTRRTCRASSHVDTQVFDSGGGVVTGKGEGVAAPVGCWSGVELVCVNERDGEIACGRSRGRVQIDVAGMGWGWLGGGGARERKSLAWETHEV